MKIYYNEENNSFAITTNFDFKEMPKGYKKITKEQYEEMTKPKSEESTEESIEE